MDPRDEFSVAHFFTVADIDRSLRFYGTERAPAVAETAPGTARFDLQQVNQPVEAVE